MCEVLGLCYFLAEHCCFVCCSADHDALYNRVSQDRDRRTLQCQVYFYSVQLSSSNINIHAGKESNIQQIQMIRIFAFLS